MYVSAPATNSPALAGFTDLFTLSLFHGVLSSCHSRLDISTAHARASCSLTLLRKRKRHSPFPRGRQAAAKPPRMREGIPRYGGKSAALFDFAESVSFRFVIANSLRAARNSRQRFLLFANGHLVESAYACLLYDAEIERVGCGLHFCASSEIVEAVAPCGLIVQSRNGGDRQ